MHMVGEWRYMINPSEGLMGDDEIESMVEEEPIKVNNGRSWVFRPTSGHG